jgi:hypothetical protein
MRIFIYLRCGIGLRIREFTRSTSTENAHFSKEESRYRVTFWQEPGDCESKITPNWVQSWSSGRSTLVCAFKVSHFRIKIAMKGVSKTKHGSAGSNESNYVVSHSCQRRKMLTVSVLQVMNEFTLLSRECGTGWCSKLALESNQIRIMPIPIHKLVWMLEECGFDDLRGRLSHHWAATKTKMLFCAVHSMELPPLSRQSFNRHIDSRKSIRKMSSQGTQLLETVPKAQ